MDFDFNDEQKAFRESVATTLEREMPRDVLMPLLDDEKGFSEDQWKMAASLGWTGLLIPEEHGGMGGGLVDAIILFEEAGKVPLPGPLFSSAGLATVAALRLDAIDLLAGLADGSTRGTVALGEVGSGDPLRNIKTRAEKSGDGWTLTGLKSVVPDGHTADWVIVAAQTDDGLGAFLVEDFEAQWVPAMDPTRKLARLELDGTPARRLGDGDATAAFRRIIDDASVLLCAESVGCAERALDLAVQYSNDRVQFGRPIGTFQAIRHMTAEMLQKLELARVGMHYAAWTSDNETDDREQSVALSKSWTSEAAIDVTGDGIQVHGGVGFTWENLSHLFFKRAKANDLLLGGQTFHRQRVAAAVIDGEQREVSALG